MIYNQVFVKNQDKIKKLTEILEDISEIKNI